MYWPDRVRKEDMKQEYRELLLKDLCARLPYGVKVRINHHHAEVVYNISSSYINDCPVHSIEPYLRPLSSMTEEEREEFKSLGGIMSYNPQHDRWEISVFTPEAYDWLNSNNFDYRGLIEKGLAIEEHVQNTSLLP